MAADYPDYSPIHIVRQGKFYHFEIYKTCPKDTATTLCNIKGKGVIYGGHILPDATAVRKTDEIECIIDDYASGAFSISKLEFRNITRPYLFPIYLNAYNNTHWIYTIGITPNIVFDKSFKIRYWETIHSGLVVYLYLDYALLE